MMKDFLTKNGSKILTILGSLGLVATAVLTAKNTLDAEQRIVEKTDDNVTKALGECTEDSKPIRYDDCKPGIKETIALTWDCYIPAAISGALSLGCFWGAELMNERQQKTLAMAYAALHESFQMYRKEAVKTAGKELEHQMDENAHDREQDKENEMPPWDERQTFFIEDYPTFFESTMEQVREAEYILNRMFVLRGYVTLNDFAELLGLEKREEFNSVGWDAESGECWYGYQWIDFGHRHRVTDDGIIVCEISMPFGPHKIFEYNEIQDQMLRDK